MSREPSPTFTVFTPTFNRAHTLHRAHGSLVAQTFRDFEWVVVDDGSSDGTAELVRGWQARTDFPIRYFYQPNSGKHMAFNRAVRVARGQFFLGLDSDDSCVPEALERFKYHWNTIPDKIRTQFSAVTCLCRDQHGNIVGTQFPKNPTDSDPLEIRYRHKVTGDKWGFHLTNVLKQHPFPELDGQPYVTESVVWNSIARSYRTRYVNEVLYTAYVEPAEDSLTKQATNARARASMFALSNRLSLEEDLSWFPFAPYAFIKNAANYVRYSLHCGQGPVAQRRSLRHAGGRALHTVTLPLGYLLYARDHRRGG
jgi:glycosyltransferase involved in cell wall biosynthesis